MEKKACYIFCAGDLYDEKINIPDNALVIAADGGLKHTDALGIKPDVILGDFDSHEKPDCDCIVYPTQKDYTDSFIAAKYALENGIKTVHMYGVLGGKRLDHTVANLAMLEHFARLGVDITLHGDSQLVTAVHAEKSASVYFDESASGYISLFAVGGNVEALSIKGLKYELENYTLKSEFPLGVSNEFTGKCAEITFGSGTLMIIYAS